jgi:hypothetical protein
MTAAGSALECEEPVSLAPGSAVVKGSAAAPGSAVKGSAPEWGSQ